MSVDDVLSSLGSSLDSGLPLDQVKTHQNKFGPNSIRPKPRNPAIGILLRQIRNPVIIVLLVAFGISLYLGKVLDGLAVIVIVLINILIGFVQEFKTEKSLQALASYAAPTGRVLRNGTVEVIPADKATPGDILILEAGDYVIADGRLSEASQFGVDEALLTGESLPVSKHANKMNRDASVADRRNMIYAGTSVVRGTGKAIVTSIGYRTEMGKIAKMLESPISPETPLQKNLEQVSRRLLLMGGLVVLVILGIGFYQGRDLQEIIMEALSLSVAVLPESLPTVVTVALLAAIRRLSKKNVLMRRMDAVETLGEVDIICTDKTGTLTTGKMEVVDFRPESDERHDLLLMTMVICNNASLDHGGSGDPTEIALISYARKLGLSPGEMKDKFPRTKEWSFDSNRKRMSIIAGSSDAQVYVKGAPESILPLCTLTVEKKAHYLREAEKLSQQGMRTMAFAGKTSDEESIATMDAAEKNLTYYGLVAIADPLREDARAAVRKCLASGIRIIMMTGDHPQTAAHIAGQLGILTRERPGVLSGNDWAKYSADELKEAFAKTNVLARVSPEHKLTLVKYLREAGHTVAMTGDGVNDGPALKNSSVGVAMGEGGTEVARQASSLILTDDNFSSIVQAVEEGRAVHGNIKRSIQFLLSQNLAELLFIGTAAIAGWPMPLNPLALLWINVVTDGVPALALAAEKIPDNFLETSGKSGWKKIFDRNFQIELYSVGILLTIMTCLIYLYGLSLDQDVATARSYAFNFLIFAILFRSLSCRHEELTFFELKPNFALLTSIMIPILIQFFMQRSPYFLQIFEVRGLSLREFFVLLGISPVTVLLLEVSKVIRRKPRSSVGR